MKQWYALHVFLYSHVMLLGFRGSMGNCSVSFKRIKLHMCVHVSLHIDTHLIKVLEQEFFVNGVPPVHLRPAGRQQRSQLVLAVFAAQTSTLGLWCLKMMKMPWILNVLNSPQIYHELAQSQWAHELTITSLLRQNDIPTSFWGSNDVIIAPSVRWG